MSFDVCSYNSSKQPQSQPSIFALAVVVVTRGRSLYFLSHPPPHFLAQAVLDFFSSPTESINCIYLNTRILPGLGAVRETASIELSVYISLKTSETCSAVSKKGNHPSRAISKGRNAKDIGQRTRCTLVSEPGRSYRSTTVVQYLVETTQKIVRYLGILLVYLQEIVRAGNCAGPLLLHVVQYLYLEKIIPKIRRTTTTYRKEVFAELIILLGK